MHMHVMFRLVGGMQTPHPPPKSATAHIHDTKHLLLGDIVFNVRPKLQQRGLFELFWNPMARVLKLLVLWSL